MVEMRVWEGAASGNAMQGRVALVTGATQGLGAAIARGFAEAGAAGIVITGRSEAAGEALAAAITAETGVAVRFLRADLADVESCRAVVAETEAAFGRLDALVNSGASTERGTLLDTSPELFDRIFAINVRGPFFLMQEAAKLMIRQEIAGTILNIASMSSLAGQPFLAAYSTSKGALVTLTRNAAFSLLRNRIRVNALNIGWMASENEDKLQKAEQGEGWLERASAKLPAGRLIDPREVARAAIFLSSPESGLMTGSAIEYDQSVWGGYDETPAPAKAL